MKHLLLTALILFISIIATMGQQYTIVKETPLPGHSTADGWRMPYKISGGKICTVHSLATQGKLQQLGISRYDLETGKLITCDTLAEMVPRFYCRDVAFTDSSFIISNSNSLIFKYGGKITYATLRSKPSFDYDTLNGIGTRNCEYFNDSVALLYDVYRYHPVDGFSGLSMHLFSLSRRRLMHSLQQPFPGIAISQIKAGNWVAVVKGRILVIDPLTAALTTYDNNLAATDSTTVPIFSAAELQANMVFRHWLDSSTASLDGIVALNVATIPPDSMFKYRDRLSNIIDNGMFKDALKTGLQQHVYIENIFATADSLLEIILVRPGSREQYRDLVVYDPGTGHILLSYENFRTETVGDTMKRPEDFFPVRITGLKGYHPWFHGDYVYSLSNYPLSVFHPGTLAALEKTIDGADVQEKRQWSILKYKLE